MVFSDNVLILANASLLFAQWSQCYGEACRRRDIALQCRDYLTGSEIPCQMISSDSMLILASASELFFQ
jgi:hypothetical protein